MLALDARATEITRQWLSFLDKTVFFIGLIFPLF